ncbi:hypothetical protein Tco_1282839 [Tanacetum coccineum]
MSLQSILTLYLLLFNLSHGRGSGFVIVELERVCRGIGLWGKVRMSCGRYLRGGMGLKLWERGGLGFGGKWCWIGSSKSSQSLWCLKCTTNGLRLVVHWAGWAFKKSS